MKVFCVGDIVKLQNPYTKCMVGMEFRILKRLCNNYFYIFGVNSNIAIHVHANELVFVRKTDKMDAIDVLHELFYYMDNENVLGEDNLQIFGYAITSKFPFAPELCVYVTECKEDEKEDFLIQISVCSCWWHKEYEIKTTTKELHNAYRTTVRLVKEGIRNCK